MKCSLLTSSLAFLVVFYFGLDGVTTAKADTPWKLNINPQGAITIDSMDVDQKIGLSLTCYSSLLVSFDLADPTYAHILSVFNSANGAPLSVQDSVHGQQWNFVGQVCNRRRASSQYKLGLRQTMKHQLFSTVLLMAMPWPPTSAEPQLALA
jgi:hypothetical protein